MVDWFDSESLSCLSPGRMRFDEPLLLAAPATTTWFWVGAAVVVVVTLFMPYWTIIGSPIVPVSVLR